MSIGNFLFGLLFLFSFGSLLITEYFLIKLNKYKTDFDRLFSRVTEYYFGIIVLFMNNVYIIYTYILLVATT